MGVSEGMHNAFKLSEVTKRLAGILAPHTNKRFWVQAEIGEFVLKAGNVYGTLVESRNGATIAKMAFRIWNSDRVRIGKTFQASGLSFDFKAGMNVCVACSLSYHAVHGVALVVEDADPRFVLGELELRRREIIERLLKAGADKSNKRLAVPRLPLRIGLIASKDSAAYHDVMQTLRQVCCSLSISFADATVQGDRAEASILRALVVLEMQNLDLVILVRGGGSKTDLASLDNERIAMRIASCAKPVWTAIGHETDNCVLDLVAHSSFKTPTALAEEITGRFRQADHELRIAVERMWREWTHALLMQRKRLVEDVTGIRQGSRKLHELAYGLLWKRSEHLRSVTTLRTATAQRRTAVSLNAVLRSSMRYVEIRLATLREHSRSMRVSAVSRLREVFGAQRNARTRLSEKRIEHVLNERRMSMRRLRGAFARLAIGAETIGMQRLIAKRDRLLTGKAIMTLNTELHVLERKQQFVLAHDPRKALARGYAIITDMESRILRTVAGLRAGDRIRIAFHDGNADATINNTENDHGG